MQKSRLAHFKISPCVFKPIKSATYTQTPANNNQRNLQMSLRLTSAPSLNLASCSACYPPLPVLKSAAITRRSYANTIQTNTQVYARRGRRQSSTLRDLS